MPRSILDPTLLSWMGVETLAEGVGAFGGDALQLMIEKQHFILDTLADDLSARIFPRALRRLLGYHESVSRMHHT